MEQFYIFVVVVLFLLAISDLVVGVSNDAVNFLNSAIGSKAAPFRAIMVVAAAGILVGATFSSGMMEVARKGIFHPESFTFAEIMLVFLAVMLTDIILLDLYNTFGLPTSTTVSIVFELLGSSVALAIIKMKKMGQPLNEMGQYINSDKALAIISGILLSVIIAFLVGALIQYLTRIIFSFNYEKTYKRYGGLFGGMAIAAITYFMLIKGAKGSSLISEENVVWIKSHTGMILLVSFAGWSAILQLLILLTRVNVFKVIVMVGTFSLAMAFAGNDLVNFIGVPLAGFQSLKLFLADPAAQADTMLMTALGGSVKTPTAFLLIAGGVMVITLWLSKKARSVTKTTIDLSRQGEGHERFGSSGFARVVVRQTRSVSQVISQVLPAGLQQSIQSRFEPLPHAVKKQKVSFDLVRASVNLVVAAILIALGTSMKLPLSTTYVTFMVAMGTSLADRAWGRESAVYRITGVLAVVSGWFVTALLAFTASFLIANFISWGGLMAIIATILLAVFLVVRTQAIHRKRALKEKEEEDNQPAQQATDLYSACQDNVTRSVGRAEELYTSTIGALIQEKRKNLSRNIKEARQLSKDVKEMKNNIPKTIIRLEDEAIESGHHYVQLLDYMREALHALNFIVKPAYDHINNNHRSLIPEQAAELQAISKAVRQLSQKVVETIRTERFDESEQAFDMQDAILESLSSAQKKQLKRIKKELVGTRNSILYISILNETKNFVLFIGNVLKSYRDFTLNK